MTLHARRGNNWLDNPYVMHLARLSLMLADHYYSALPRHAPQRVRGEDGYALFANTDSNGLKQPLDEHLLGVARDAGFIAHALRTHLSPVLAQWITYFEHFREEEVMQQIQHPPIQKAYQHLHALSGDDLARREAFVRERALRDEITEKAAARAEGIVIGQATILHRQLRAKFGELPPSIEERLQAAEPAQLAHWADKVLFAETLEQVFSQH